MSKKRVAIRKIGWVPTPFEETHMRCESIAYNIYFSMFVSEQICSSSLCIHNADQTLTIEEITESDSVVGGLIYADSTIKSALQIYA